jgi:hypothetical protein
VFRCGLVLTVYQITLLADGVEPHDPPLNTFRLTTGTWVEFPSQREGDQTKRRGYVKYVDGMHATVLDEHALAEVRKCVYFEGN